MSEEKKNEVLQDKALDDSELDGVAGGASAAVNLANMNNYAPFLASNFASNFAAQDDGKIGGPGSK